MSKSSKLKQLQSSLNLAKKDLSTQKKQSSEINHKIVATKRKIGNIKNEINILTRNVVISEHALLRYLERVKFVDIEAIKKEILADDKIVNAIHSLDSGSFPIQGCRLIVKDKVIKTIVV